MQINNRRRLQHTRIEFHNRNPNFKLFHKRIETCKRKRWSQDAKTQLDKIYPFFYHCNNSNEQRCGALSLSLYRQSAFCFVLFCFFDPGRLWRDGMNNSRGDFFFFWVLACTQLAGNWFLVLSRIAKIFSEKVSLRTFSMTSFKIPSTFFFSYLPCCCSIRKTMIRIRTTIVGLSFGWRIHQLVAQEDKKRVKSQVRWQRCP